MKAVEAAEAVDGANAADGVEAAAQRIAEAFQTHLSEKWLRPRGPGGLRISEIGYCGRRHVGRVLGLLQEESTLDDAAIWEAGRIYEDYTAQILDRAFGGHGVGYVRQLQVATPYCTGYADWYILQPLRLIADTKSVDEWAEGWGLPRPEHVAQVRGYLRWVPEAEGGLLIYWLKGKSMQMRVFPVPRDQAAEEAVEAELAFLSECVRRQELPPAPEGMDPFSFPCRWEARGNGGLHVCSLWGSCHGEMPQVASDRAVQAGKELAEIRRQQAALNQDLYRLRRLGSRAEQTLEEAARGLSRVVVDCGEVLVEGEVRPGQPRYDIKKAIQAGAVQAEALEPFCQPGKDRWDWTVRYRPNKKAQKAEGVAS